MKYRPFGQTDIHISEVSLGGLLARYEGVLGHPPPDIKRQIYLRADELGINLFDMGYGDEVHIPDELKGHNEHRFFALKVGNPEPETLEEVVDKHLANIRRDTIDILRIHHHMYVADSPLKEIIEQLKQKGKIRALCLIRHFRADQESYAASGPETSADGDLVIYNYVCRWQSPGIDTSRKAQKGVLIMKSLGGQWIDWHDMISTDWTQANEDTILDLAANKQKMVNHKKFVFPINAGPWHELADAPGKRPRTSAAVQWVLQNQGVSSVLVAVASVEELEELLEVT